MLSVVSLRVPGSLFSMLEPLSVCEKPSCSMVSLVSVECSDEGGFVSPVWLGWLSVSIVPAYVSLRGYSAVKIGLMPGRGPFSKWFISLASMYLLF